MCAVLYTLLIAELPEELAVAHVQVLTASLKSVNIAQLSQFGVHLGLDLTFLEQFQHPKHSSSETLEAVIREWISSAKNQTMTPNVYP